MALAKEKLTEMDLEIIDLRLLALGLKDFDKKGVYLFAKQVTVAVAIIRPIRPIICGGVLSHNQEYPKYYELKLILRNDRSYHSCASVENRSSWKIISAGDLIIRRSS